MTDDDPIARAAANCAEAYRRWAAGLDKPWRTWDDLVVADLGLAIDLPPNHASTLRPLTDDDVPSVVERMRSFFDGSPGGGYELWSAWPTPDLSAVAAERWDVPLMIRPAGGEARPAPPELEIVEVDDERSAIEASSLLTAFDLSPDDAVGWITPALMGDEFRFWLGRVDGWAASMAAASVSHGYVGIYAVATAESFRGHGYGEALTWRATLSRPDLPATLQASPMGRPVYERMGYEVAATCWNWSFDRR
jgi:hypothetical protein